MIETCKTCPAWKQDSDEPGWGDCQLGRSIRGYRVEADTLAFGLDGEAYNGFLITHETFGCNQRPRKWPRGE